MGSIIERIPNALYNARVHAGLSQESLAEKLNISKNTLRSYESGGKTPTMEFSLGWCEACGYDVDRYLSEVYRLHIVSSSESEDREAIIRYARTAPPDQVAALSSIVRVLEVLNGKA